ncbi:MAG: DNA translocase FtsK [Oscillospiraceae bacterium]
MAAKKKPTGGAAKKRVTKPNKGSEINKSWSILAFGIGIIILAMTYIKGEAVWAIIRTAIFAVFGVGTYLIGPAIIFVAVLVALGKPIWGKILKILILMLFVTATVFVFSKAEVRDVPFVDIVKMLYATGAQAVGSGVLGGLLGVPLILMCGRPAANIILVVLVLVGIMLVTSVTPGDVFSFFHGHVSTAKEKRNERRAKEEEYAATHKESLQEENNTAVAAQRQSRDKDRRTDIDVPLGPTAVETVEMPPEEKPIIGPGGTFGMFPPREKDVASENAFDAFDEDYISSDTTPFEPTPNSDDMQVAQPTASFDTSAHVLPSMAPLQAPIEELIKKAVSIAPEIITDKNDQLTIVPAQGGKMGYTYPPLSLFRRQVIAQEEGVEQELAHNADLLVKTLASFGVQTRVLDISRGPSVTRYELQPLAGVKISRITGLSDDIALNLATAGVRIEAPIPNKAAVGIEVPNRTSVSVSIRSILESTQFAKSTSPLTLALGKDIAGVCQVTDLTKMPHLLIAGSTGSGKSVCINSIIISILYKSSPDDVKLIMIDPKVVELAEYNGIPHLLMPVVTEPRKAAGALGSAVAEMEKRYRLFAESNVRDIKTYNKLAEETEGMEKLPYIAIVIDELADLMMVAGKEVEDYICRIAQKARAAGMHLIVATQRPSVDVITGLIKANIPSRIAFAVSSQIDSRTILDAGGAEKLLGMGDMLFLPVGASKPIRIQGTYVRDEEISDILSFIKKHGEADYSNEMIQEMEKRAVPEKANGSQGQDDDSGVDVMFNSAVEVILDAGQGSTSLLQRRLKLGYARAARIMDEMEAAHIIGPFEGSKPRAVLISRQQWIEMTMQQSDTQQD